MDKEIFFIKIKAFTKDNGKMIVKVVKDFFIKQKHKRYIREDLKMVWNMEKEFVILIMEIKLKGYGKLIYWSKVL